MNAILPILPALASLAWASAAPLNLPQEPGYTGSAYWSQFQATKGRWDRPEFFPVGVWKENLSSPEDAQRDKDTGINTYVTVTAPSNVAFIRAAGMYLIEGYEVTQPSTPEGFHLGLGDETVGWFVGDEYDMQYGPGASDWDGTLYDPVNGYQHCVPKKSECGFTVTQRVRAKFPDSGGRFYMANYAKTVAVWGETKKVAPFINAGWQDTTALDLYWYSDRDACIPSQGGRYALDGLIVGTGPLGWGVGSPPALLPEECHRASNFGANIERLRQIDALDGKFQPLWCFPESRNRPEQIQGAIMSCLIHGAQGIVYFNHNFDEPCISHHVLREPCFAAQRAAATSINRLIAKLAPVLNAPRLKWNFGEAALSTRLSQASDGTAYIFAQQDKGQSGKFTLALPPALSGATSAKATCSGSPLATGTVPVAGGKLSVAFAKESDWCIWAIPTGAAL